MLEEFFKITTDLAASAIDDQTLREESRMPSFKLNDVYGQSISTDELLKKGPLVISFYAGGWCGFCNLELQVLQRHFPQMREQNANLIALSPELPERSIKSVEKFDLKFHILSDLDNKVAKSFGLVYEIRKELANLYRLALDLDLQEIFGTEKYELPISATYVVNKEGIIKYAFVDSDANKKMEPSLIVEVLKNLE